MTDFSKTEVTFVGSYEACDSVTDGGGGEDGTDGGQTQAGENAWWYWVILFAGILVVFGLMLCCCVYRKDRMISRIVVDEGKKGV